jgi:hypothetical protein
MLINTISPSSRHFVLDPDRHVVWQVPVIFIEARASYPETDLTRAGVKTT